jgi:uncharacterized damage-inducible protein DinB
MLSELENYQQRIVDLRDQVYELVEGLPAEALNWRPLPPPPGPGTGEVNSLAVLAAHIAGAEHFWIGEVVGGLPATRDRDAEFSTTAADATNLLRRLEATAAETGGVFARLVPSDLEGAREVRGRTVAARWCILHVIDHTALHLGHMQLTYQLWQGGQGVASPFWHERLPA